MLDKLKNNLNKKDEKGFLVFSVLFLIFIFIENCTNVFDTDLLYFIPNGEYILKNGIPYINPFISTEGLPIVIQNWLHCVICALANNLGSWGLFALQMILVLIALVLCFYFLKDVKKLSYKCLYIGVFIICFVYWSIRPQIPSFILCMLEIIGLENYNKSGKIGWLFLLPISTLLEINIHASYWIMHYIILLPYFVPFFNKITPNTNIKDKEKLLTLFVFVLFSFLVMLINPYGVDNIIYVFKALGGSTFEICNNIGEQQSWALFSIYGFLIIAMVFLFGIGLSKKKIDSTSFYMFLGCTFLAIYKAKFLPFFALGILYLFRCFKDLKEIKIKRGVVVVLLAFILGFALNSNYSSFSIDPLNKNNIQDFQYLEEMADYLDENEDKDVSIMAYFQWENYFEYRGYKVYSDARPELYSEEMLKTQNMFYAKDGSTSSQRKKLYDSIDVDYAVVTTYSQVYEDLKNNKNYILIIENEQFSMFEKLDVVII